ncbi:MAG: hypothetical protein GY810_02075, partial [Aureispira sp.]|nr:hypothetical protein [Aureispira sp.]
MYVLNTQKQAFQIELNNQNPPTKLRGIGHNSQDNLITGGVGFLIQKDSLGWSLNQQLGIPGLLHNALGIYADTSGLWVGLDEGVLLHYPPTHDQAQSYRSCKPYTTGVLWQPYRSKNSQIWVGASNGLFHLDDKQLIPFDSSSTDLDGVAIYAFHDNKQGTWLSTSTGLYLVDLDKKIILDHFSSALSDKNYIPTRHIAHLHEDKKGIFWLATKGDGLIRWNPKTKTYKQYTQKGTGLSHNVLYSVYGDDFGSLWLSSQRGLMRFNKKSEHVNIYLEEDGLPHNEFNTISHYQAADGRLYFGGQSGMIHFHPKDWQKTSVNAPFIITGYKKQTQDTLVNLTAKLIADHTITLAPSDKSFSLNFALL